MRARWKDEEISWNCPNCNSFNPGWIIVCACRMTDMEEGCSSNKNENNQSLKGDTPSGASQFHRCALNLKERRFKMIKNTSKEEVHLEWTMGGNPRAIEAQEARGQNQLVNSQQLPVDCPDKEVHLEICGPHFI